MENGYDNKTLYDANWAAWSLAKKIGPMSRHTRRLVFNACRSMKISSVLDVGCGPGIFLSEFSARFPGSRLTGIDVSDSAITMATKLLPEGTFHQLDISTNTAPGIYDLITMIDVAEHIEDDISAFRNIRKSCGGHLVISTIEGRMRPFEKQVGHMRNYAPGELAEKLRIAAFEVISYKNWGWPTYSPIYRDLTPAIEPHKAERIPLSQRLLAHIAYAFLSINVPRKGDMVVVVARPAP